MNFNIRNRFIIFAVVFFGLFVLLFIQLAKLTLVKGAEYAAKAEKLRPETIVISGARGSILDRNGLPLAYDQKSYNVQFYRDPQKNSTTDRANYTRIIMDAIKLIEANGGKTLDSFAIQYDKETDSYYFDWGDILESAKERREENWRKNMYVSVEKKDDEVDRAALKGVMESGLLSRIAEEITKDSNVAEAEGEAESEAEAASKTPADYGYSVSPEEIYLTLRDRYQIPAETGYEEARKILSVWQDAQLASWRAFEPVTIAYNVNIQTVAEIETHTVELTGMSIAESTTRIYPRGSLAAHIIGYTGRITGEIINDYSVSKETENKLTALTNLSSSKLFSRIISEELEGSVLQKYIETGALSSKSSLAEFGYTAEELEGVKGLLDLGYSVDGLIGIQGIEKTMESYLTGDIKKRQGVQNVEVDNKKIIRNILSMTEPKQGDSIVLTLDVPFQQAVERSLEKNIALIREEQIEQYNKYKDKEGPRLGKKAYKGIELEDISLAESGAAVVFDVNNGAVLAMASHPSFDLNLFVKGMTKEEYKAFGFEDKELAPLLNRAVSSRGTPGSIFKMVTGLGALMEGQKDPSKGTVLSERIDDEGPFYFDKNEKTSDAPSCWQTNISKHQKQTIVEGLQNSCNYYFYTLSYRMGINKLNEWGEKYGLTVRTGIELPGELAGQVGGQTVLFDPGKPINMQASYMPRLVFDGPFGIVRILSKFAENKGLNYDEEEIKAAAREIVYLMGIEWSTRAGSKILVDDRNVAMGDHIRSILYKHLNITAPVANANNLVPEISSMLSQLMWKPINTIQTGIGQGYVQLTPLAVARYVAAIVNGGTVYEPQIVDKVIDKSGELVYDKQPVVYSTLGAPQEFLDKIKEGMSKVVSAEQGTAEKYFRNFKYKDDIGGKTGTAEVSEIDLENNSWFVCFAPYDKPKIAVVAYVPHGLSGGLSSYIVQDIVEFYLDREAKVAEQTIPVSDSLIGQ